MTGDRTIAGRRRRARARSATQHRDRARGRDRDRSEPAASRRRRAWRRAIDRVWAAGDCVETHHRVTSRPVVDRARHAREQTRAGGRRERDRRRRDLRRRRRYRRHEDLRVRSRVAPASPSARHATPSFDFVTRRSKHDVPRRLLPGREADHGEGRRRAGDRATARQRRSSGEKAPRSASTCSPPRSGTT